MAITTVRVWVNSPITQIYTLSFAYWPRVILNSIAYTVTYFILKFLWPLNYRHNQNFCCTQSTKWLLSSDEYFIFWASKRLKRNTPSSNLFSFVNSVLQTKIYILANILLVYFVTRMFHFVIYLKMLLNSIIPVWQIAPHIAMLRKSSLLCSFFGEIMAFFKPFFNL